LLSSESDQKVHMYCIAIQEVTKLSTRNVATGMHIDHSFPWRLKIESILQPLGYVKLVSQHLVGLVTVLYVQANLAKHISDVATKTIAAGVMGVGGNKGAVCIVFKFYQSKMCIVNCHLAAHQEKVKQRNQVRVIACL
jgi:hypothetical protein